MIPLDRGGPAFMLGSIDYQDDVRAYAQVPHVLLIGWLCYPRVSIGHSMIGYDLREVAAGRSTVVGLPQQREMPESGAQFTVFGPSLNDVFSEVIRSYHSSWTDREDRAAFEERREAAFELDRKSVV